MISVIMPVFNSVQYLEESIDSILNQTYSDFELFLLDDGSTDGSVEIIQRYAKKDKRVKAIFNDPFLGLTKTLNKGLKLAAGEFIARMDSDDIAHPERFEKQLAQFKSDSNLGVCGSWTVSFGGVGRFVVRFPVTDDLIRADFILRCPIAHPAAMYKKAVLDKHNLHYDDVNFDGACEDYDFLRSILKVSKGYNIPEPLLQYRRHQTQASKVVSQKMHSLSQKVVDEYLKDIGLELSEKVKALIRGLTYRLDYDSESFEHAKKAIEVAGDLMRKKGFKHNATQYFYSRAWLTLCVKYRAVPRMMRIIIFLKGLGKYGVYGLRREDWLRFLQ